MARSEQVHFLFVAESLIFLIFRINMSMRFFIRKFTLQMFSKDIRCSFEIILWMQCCSTGLVFFSIRSGKIWKRNILEARLKCLNAKYLNDIFSVF